MVWNSAPPDLAPDTFMNIEQCDFRKYLKTANSQGIDGNSGYKVGHKHSIQGSDRSPTHPFHQAARMRGTLPVNSAKGDRIPNPFMQIV